MNPLRQDLSDDMKRVADAIDESVFFTEWASGKIIWANRTACELYRYSLEKLYTRTIHSLSSELHPYTEQASIKHFSKSGSASLAYEWQMNDQDGRLFWVHLKAKTIESNGRPLRMVYASELKHQRKNENEQTAFYFDLEQQLSQQSIKIDLLFELSSELLCVSNEKGYFVQISKSWESTLGYTSEQLLSTPYMEWLHPDDVASTMAIRQTLSNQKPICHFINRYRNRNGTYRWLEWSATPFGELTIASARDITESRRIQEALKASEARLKELFNNMHSACVLFHAVDDGDDFIIVDINAAALNLERKSKSEMQGKLCSELHTCSGSEEQATLLRQVWTTGESTRVVLQVNQRWRDISCYKLPSGEVVLMFDDVTEHRLMVEALRQSEEQLRLITENTSDVIWSVDLSGNVLFVSPSIQRMTGYSLEEALQLPSDFWYTQETQWVVANHMAKVRECVLKGQRIEQDHFEAQHRRKDGTTIYVEAHYGGVYTSSGRFMSIVGITRDITDRKRIEAELLREKNDAEIASRFKTDFLSTSAHEIRTPLNVILGYTEILREVVHSEEQKDFVDKISSSGQMLLNLINDILDISKIESGTVEVRSSPLDIPRLVLSLVDLMKGEAERKGIELRSEISRDLSLSYRLGDEQKLRQVLVNLIGNAIKFTEKGHITVSVHPDPESFTTLIFRVIDTGPGISTEDQKKIFSRFFQSKESAMSSGLGLHISKQLVEYMGGTIAVASELGKGTTISIRLSLLPIQSQNTPSIPSVDSNRSLRPMVILLAEDSTENQELVRLFLRHYPFQLDVASNGNDALQLFMKSSYDLVLMDMQMPGMNGYEVTRACRSRERELGLKLTPIIAMTASALMSDRDRCIQEGCTDYMSKPFKKKELLDMILKYS